MYTIKVHEDDEAVAVHYYQDVEPVMDACKVARDHDSGPKGEFRRTMQIPMIVIQALCDKYKLDFFNSEHAQRIMKILRGPDFKVFRTVNDKVI
jgi:hypothetical protein